MSKERITHFQIGPDPEKDIICVEDLLMQLGMAQAVLDQLYSYIKVVEDNDGVCPSCQIAPDNWGVTGASNALHKIAYALKAGCWGYADAHNH